MILCTGGAGYIGTHLVHRLHELNLDCVALDNLRNPFYVNKIDNLIVGDINDSDMLDELFKKYDIDQVVHLAAMIDAGESQKRPNIYFYVNVSGTCNLLSTCIRYGVKKFVFASSFAVYNESDKKISEDHRIKPGNTYGITKMMCEIAINRYSLAYNLPYVILRFANVGGGGVGRKDLISRCMKNDSIIVNGNDFATKDGTAVRDYVHVDDVVNGIILALQCDKMFETYNLSSGIETSVLDVIKAISQYKKLEYSFDKRRIGDVGYSVGNSDKFRFLGWKPEKNLDDIIRTTKKYLDVIKK